MLRAQVLAGQPRPEGLAVLVYHGMARGLAVLLTSAASPRPGVEPRAPERCEVPARHEFVRVLANMLLQSQSEAMHVY